MAKVRYWIEWIDNQTNDRHNTDLHETQEDAMKAVPYRAYRESIRVFATYAEPACFKQYEDE